jgi:hypothetical protein
MLHDHGHSRLPVAHPGLVPPLQPLHIGVNHVDSAMSTWNCISTIAPLILSGSPFLSALFAAFLASTVALTPPTLLCSLP